MSIFRRPERPLVTINICWAAVAVLALAGHLAAHRDYFAVVALAGIEIGWLSLLELMLVAFYLWSASLVVQHYSVAAGQTASAFQRQAAWLQILLAFATGTHLVGGEIQNQMLRHRQSGPLLDLANFYDHGSHVLVFIAILLLGSMLCRMTRNLHRGAADPRRLVLAATGSGILLGGSAFLSVSQSSVVTPMLVLLPLCLFFLVWLRCGHPPRKPGRMVLSFHLASIGTCTLLLLLSECLPAEWLNKVLPYVFIQPVPA